MQEYSPNNPEENASVEPSKPAEIEKSPFVLAHEENMLLEYLNEIQQSFSEPAEEITSWINSIKTCMRNMEQDMNDLLILTPEEESRHESALDVQSQYSRLLEIFQEMAHSTGIFNQPQKKKIALLFSAFDALAQKVLPSTFPNSAEQDPQKSFLELKQSLQDFAEQSKPYQRLVSMLEKKISTKVDSWIRTLEGKYLDSVGELLLRRDIAGLTGKIAKLCTIFGVGFLAMDCAAMQKEIHDTVHEPPSPDGGVDQPDEVNDVSVEYNPRGELFLHHGDINLGLVRTSRMGLLHDPDDILSESAEQLISGLSLDRPKGVNYKISDPERFRSFVVQEAHTLISKINSAGAQTPIEWAQLKEDELIQLSFLIVQENLTYDYLSTNYPHHSIDEEALDKDAREQIAESRQEDEKISKMPLDTMLMEYQRGVCRHYAALVPAVSEILKQSSGSPYPKNIHILPFSSLDRNHAYNIILEQNGKNTILAYFLDITAVKDKFALSELDALSGRQIDYLSIEEFLSKSKALAPLFSEEEITLAMEKLLELNQQNLPKRQLWAEILADRYYIEGIGEGDKEVAKKAEHYYKIALETYKDILKYNRAQSTKSRNTPNDFYRMYDPGSTVTRYLTLLQRERNFDTAQEIVLDNDFFSSHYFAPGIVSSSNQENRRFNVASLIHQLFQNGEYQRILDLNKRLTFSPGLSAQADILDVFLATGNREEALQYVEEILSLQNMLHEKYPLKAIQILLEKFNKKSPWKGDNSSSRAFFDYENFTKDIWEFSDKLYLWDINPNVDALFKKGMEIDWPSAKLGILSELFSMAVNNDQGEGFFLTAFLNASSDKIDSLLLDGSLSAETLNAWEKSIDSHIRESITHQGNVKTQATLRKRLGRNLKILLSYERNKKIPIKEGLDEVVSQGPLFGNYLPLLAIEVEMEQKNRDDAFKIFEEFFLSMDPSRRMESAQAITDDLINRNNAQDANVVDRPKTLSLHAGTFKLWLDALEREELDEFDTQRIFEVYAYTGRLLLFLDTAVETKGTPFIKKYFLDDIGAYFYRIYYSNREGNPSQMAHLFSDAREYHQKGYPITNYFQIILVEAYLDSGDWKTAETILNTSYDKFESPITLEDRQKIINKINALKMTQN